MVRNVYIHIPFCRQKCRYCSFISYPKLSCRQDYIKALISEVRYNYKNELLETLYFGGGTPSLLDGSEFSQIIKLFNISSNTELTCEINPENITPKYLNDLRHVGINRLSIGCQTFNDNILNIIGRRHSSTQVKYVVQAAQQEGFNNLSLDFIYGLPNQNINDFLNDLKIAVDLGVPHISLYGLKIEEGCYFYLHRPDGLPDEGVQAQMYLKAIDFLESHGFNHYEISNFAKKGYESKHNLNYWRNNSYYGFGAAAHGYIGNTRYSNFENLEEYISNPLIHANEHILSTREILEEEIFLGFRKMDGINVRSVNEKFSINFDWEYKKIIDKYISYGYLIKTSAGYKLTNNGILVSNFILADFLQ